MLSLFRFNFSTSICIQPSFDACQQFLKLLIAVQKTTVGINFDDYIQQKPNSLKMNEDDKIAIRHLLLALKDQRLVDPKKSINILNNIVYFVPRITDIDELREIVKAVFSWTPQTLTVWEWYEACNSILRWKLEISEPHLPLHEFLMVWNDEISGCKSWTVYQLANVAGFLACKVQLKSLQEQLFLDDTGNAVALLDNWKYTYFLPIWNEYSKVHFKDTIIVKDLCVLYAMVHSKSDSYLPFDSIFVNLLSIIINYIKEGSAPPVDKRNEFFLDHLNIICQVCAHCIPHLREEELLMDSLSGLCSSLKKFSDSDDHLKKRRYNDKYYTNILFSVVLLLSGITPTACMLQPMIYSLFYISFILEDFGMDGFSKYQNLIHSLCTVLIKDFQLYDKTLKGMLQQLKNNPANKIQHAKMMFVLQFLEITLANLELPNVEYLQNRIVPFIEPLLKDEDRQLRESSHVVWLAIYNNESWSDGINAFKLEKIRPYLLMSMNQYTGRLMSEKQLIEIWKQMTPSIKYLSSYDRDLVRNLLHTTYLKIINTENLDFKSTFIQCLIEQFYNVNERFIWDWLETTHELFEPLPSSSREPIVTKLWQFISHSHNELAIRWWYDRIVPTLSLL